MHTQYELTVGGSSNAAEGPVHGLLLRSVLLNDRIIACNSNLARCDLFDERLQAAVTTDNRTPVHDSFIILVAAMLVTMKLTRGNNSPSWHTTLATTRRGRFQRGAG